MEISPPRIFCRKGLKIAFSILVFQILFLAPVPDAFDPGYDLAFLKKPGTANFVKRTPALRFPDEAGAALDRPDRPERLPGAIVPFGPKKHVLPKRKTSVSDEDKGPPVSSLGMTPASQGSLPDTFHAPFKTILRFVARYIAQLESSHQGLFPNLGQGSADWLAPDFCLLAATPRSGLGLRRLRFVQEIADRISPVVNFAFCLPLRNVHHHGIPS
jgi:hypothetical protein